MKNVIIAILIKIYLVILTTVHKAMITGHFTTKAAVKRLNVRIIPPIDRNIYGVGKAKTQYLLTSQVSRY